MPKISLKPDRVTKYNEVLIRNLEKNTLVSLPKERKKIYNLETFEEIKFEKQFHNFNISSSAQRKIKEKINWLYLLSRSRYQKSYTGKDIFNFKINFLTLTLPSKQKHNTAEITKKCLNQFITEIKERTKMENYVWRLEFQKNGNVHYHIVTDTFIDYSFALKVWNRILNKLDYIRPYTEKFSEMTLSDYVSKNHDQNINTFELLAKRYAKGKKESWKNPPTVDVKVCTNNKAIANYISKYFGKKADNESVCNSLDNEENSFSLRLWFCSRSLSKLTSIVDYEEIITINWFDALNGLEKVRNFVSDYANCLFFNIKDLSNNLKSLLYQTFRNYANENLYNSA